MSAKKSVDKPRLTDAVLNGVIAATEAILAGDCGEGSDVASDVEDIQRANAWARKMLDFRAGR